MSVRLLWSFLLHWVNNLTYNSWHIVYFSILISVSISHPVYGQQCPYFYFAIQLLKVGCKRKPAGHCRLRPSHEKFVIKYLKFFLKKSVTWANDPSIFKVVTVMSSQSLMRTLLQWGLVASALHLIQPNLALSLTIAGISYRLAWREVEVPGE